MSLFAVHNHPDRVGKGRKLSYRKIQPDWIGCGDPAKDVKDDEFVVRMGIDNLNGYVLAEDMVSIRKATKEELDLPKDIKEPTDMEIMIAAGKITPSEISDAKTNIAKT